MEFTSTGPQTIAEWYHSCIATFEKITAGVNNLVPVDYDTNCDSGNANERMAMARAAPQLFQDQIGRFRVWVRNMGAHRVGRMSLDYKLREASHIRDEVLELLGELSQSLQDILSAMTKNAVDVDPLTEGLLNRKEDDISGSGSTIPGNGATLLDLVFMLDDTSDIISCLYTLSVSIRQPVPEDRLRKCAKIDMSHYEIFDKQHVLDKFPRAKPFLIQRLGFANTQRRQFFEYRLLHHEKIAGPENEITDHYQGSPTVITTGTSTTISIVPRDFVVRTPLDGIEAESDGGRTATSFGAGSVAPDTAAEHLQVPDPPQAEHAFAGNAFRCPYCYSLIAVKNLKDWQQHVFRDLRPYSCTFESCTKPNRLFETRYEWYDHEVRQHRREWYCAECAVAFPTIPKFTCHLEKAHPTLLVEKQEISTLFANCERALSRPQECPLCDLDSKYTPRRLRNHLSRHMQQLALFTLPRLEIDQSGGKDVSNVAGVNENDDEWSINDAEPYEEGTLSVNNNSEEVSDLVMIAEYVEDDHPLEWRLESVDPPSSPQNVTIARNPVKDGDDDSEPLDPDEPMYCLCNGVSYGTMLGCDDRDCAREWFHLGCVGLKHPPSRNEKWYCPECLAKRERKERA